MPLPKTDDWGFAPERSLPISDGSSLVVAVCHDQFSGYLVVGSAHLYF